MKAYFCRRCACQVFFVVPLLHPKHRRQSSNPLRHCCVLTFSTSLVGMDSSCVLCDCTRESGPAREYVFFSPQSSLVACVWEEWMQMFWRIICLWERKVAEKFFVMAVRACIFNTSREKKENANELCYTNCQVHSFWYARERECWLDLLVDSTSKAFVFFWRLRDHERILLVSCLRLEFVCKMIWEDGVHFKESSFS